MQSQTDEEFTLRFIDSPPTTISYSAPTIASNPSVPLLSDFTGTLGTFRTTFFFVSLETWTKFIDPRLPRLFDGDISIVLDSLKQHCFNGYDGQMFRHVLNFVRNSWFFFPSILPMWKCYDFEMLKKLGSSSHFNLSYERWCRRPRWLPLCCRWTGWCQLFKLCRKVFPRLLFYRFILSLR